MYLYKVYYSISFTLQLSRHRPWNDSVTVIGLERGVSPTDFSSDFSLVLVGSCGHMTFPSHPEFTLARNRHAHPNMAAITTHDQET